MNRAIHGVNRLNGMSESTLAGRMNSLRAEYDASRDTRFRRQISGVSWSGSGADFHFRSDASYLKIMELARDFDRNDQVVGQGVSRVLANVLQDGAKLDMKTGNEDADKYILNELWLPWATDKDACDISGEQTLDSMASLALRSVIVDGDVFALPTDKGSIDLVEGHRCQTPTGTKKNVVLGVKMDDNRNRQEFWFTKQDIGFQRAHLVGDMRQIPARGSDGNRQVLQMYLPKRKSQTRGVSALAPIANPVSMFGDTQLAQMVQQQIVSCYTIIHEFPDKFPDSTKGDPAGEESTEQLGDGSTRDLEGISPGVDYIGAPGEVIKGFSPNVPSPAYFEFASLTLTLISINLDLPLAVLLLDPSKTNFSGWRGAMDQARLRFQTLYRFVVRDFYEPIFRWKMRQWLATEERLQKFAARADRRTKENILRHIWSDQFWPYIEPNKDAMADALIVKSNLNSERRVLARRGLPIDEIHAEIIADRARFIEDSIKATEAINKEFPDAKVDWREIAGTEPLSFNENVSLFDANAAAAAEGGKVGDDE